jgi:hypothetical protein
LLGFRVGGLARVRIANEFNRAHATESANVADQRPLFLPRASARLKMLSDRCRPRQQTIFLDSFNRREGRGAGRWMPTECSTQPANSGRVHDFGAARIAGDVWAAQRFASGDVGSIEMLGCEPNTGGARGSRLHLVGDEQDSVLAADRAQSSSVRAAHEGLAENRFGDNSGQPTSRDDA